MSMLVWEGEKKHAEIELSCHHVFFPGHGFFQQEWKEPAKSHAYPPVNSNIVMENSSFMTISSSMIFTPYKW